MKKGSYDRFNFRGIHGSHYALLRLPIWATAAILFAVTQLVILVGRNALEGVPYNIAFSSAIGDAGIVVGILIAATILQRFWKAFVYMWPQTIMGHTLVALGSLALGVVANVLTIKSRSGQAMDTYHDFIITPLILYLAVTLVPTIYHNGTRVEKFFVAFFVLVWLALVGFDTKYDRMNQRQWLHSHVNIIEQMK